MKAWVTSICIFFYASASQAYIKSDFDINGGVTFLDIELEGVGDRSLESYSTIKIDYNLIFSSIDTSLTLSMMEIYESNFGILPYTRFSAGPRWYMRGINGNRILLDNQVQGRLWKPSPFVGFQLGFGSLSLADETEAQLANDFNAAVVDANIEVGLETPLSSDILFVGHFSYLVSVLSTSDESRPALSYGGMQIFLGLKMTQF